MISEFIDREQELAFLESAWDRPEAQLVVLYGRRRVGKTALIREFAAARPAIYFMATQMPEEQQLAELGEVVGRALNDALLAENGFRDWDQLFRYIAQVDRRLVFALDEFPYHVQANSAVPSILQRAWDTELARSNVFMILCGSSVAMMERQTLAESSPLFGRRTGQLRLRPFGFRQARAFLPRYSVEDQIRSLSILGGTPYYLQLFDDSRPLADNLKQSVFSVGSPLRDEVEFLLRQELRQPRVYFGILAALSAGKRRISEIANATGLKTTSVNRYLAILQDLELVEREVPATESRPEKSKKGLYRIVDPFVRFWFSDVLRHRSLLESGRTEEAFKRVMDSIDRHAAAYYEEAARAETAAGLLDGSTGHNWIRVGRWWDRNGEIDVMAFADDGASVLFGEAKWSSKAVGTNILENLETTAARAQPTGGAGQRSFALFSRSGFTPALERRAECRNDLFLIKGLEISANH